MALFGTLDHLSQVLATDTRFQAGFAYIRHCLIPGSAESTRLLGLALDGVEEIPLASGSVAFDQVYATRGRDGCFFESHRKYIDIQFILEGEECIDVLPIGDLAVTKAYRDEKDVIKYADNPGGNRLRLRAGEGAVFFPEDGHMPGQFANATGVVRKTVVKVPVA